MKNNLLATIMLPVAVTSLSAVALAQASAVAPSSQGYTLKQKIRLKGQGKWDYAAIDEVRQRLYLSRGDHVQVLQLPSGKPIAEIADTPHAHGFAFAEDLKLGFVSAGDSNSVTAFDLETMRPRQQIKVGGNPDAILYEPHSHKLFTFNGKTHDVSVVDARTLAVVATMAAGGRPEFAVSDGAGKIYFNIEDKGAIGVIDVPSNQVVAHWKLNGCEEPSGLAIDAKRQRLFSTCQNRVMAVTDARTGARVTTVAIGEHPDAAAFDAGTGTLFASNGGGTGTLSVIHEDDGDRYTVLGEVRTEKAAKTMAFDTATRAVYLPTIVDGDFSVLVFAPR